jgi:iron complex outermembrane receptor protein
MSLDNSTLSLKMFYRSLLMAGAVFWLPAPAFAQSAAQPAASSSGLEEIVVTARRREEKLQTVPVAITAFSGKALEEHEIRTSEELSHIVPSLSINGPFGNGNVTNLRLRGLPGVATYFAEVPTFLNTAESTSLNGNAQFVDLENVQVLKGPQGVAFGLNTTGGAILFEPNRPTNNFEGYAQVTLGDFNRHGIEAALNLPIVDDKVLLRVTVARNERDGYTKDLSSKQDYSNLDYWYGRGSITLRPTDEFENYTVVDYYFSQDNGPGVILSAVNPRIAGAILPAINKDLALQKTLGIRQVVGEDPGLLPVDRSQDWRVIDIAKWDITENFSIKNIASYSKAQELQRIDLDGAPQNAINVVGGPNWGAFGTNPNTEAYSEEFQLSGKALNEKLNVIAGGFVSFSHNAGPSETTTIVFGGLSNTSSFSPADHGSAGRTQGLYAQGVYDMSGLSSVLEGLKFTAGYRYTWDWRTAETSQRNPKGVCTTLGADSNCVLVTDGAFHAFGWNLSLDYQIDPDSLVYVRSSRGYTSGGFNNVAPPEFRNFKPEYATDVEIGVKADWEIAGIKARTNVDAFHIWYKNIQRSVNASFTNASGVVQIGSFTTNAAAAQLDGIEFEGTVLPVKGVELTASYSYIHSKYDKFVSVDPATRLPLDLSGLAFTNFPKTQFSLTGRYHLPLDPALGDISVAATYNSQSSTQFGLVPNDVGAFEPAYDNLDLRIDWTNMFGQSLDGAFFMTNAADNVHRLGSFTVFTSVGTVADIYNEPRIFGFSLKYRFGGPAAESESAPSAYVPPPAQAPMAAPKSYLVFFDFNKSDLTPQAVTIVDQAAKNTGPSKVTQLTVTGHTDTVGSDAYNMRLSRRRAESVAARLEKDGIPSSEIAIVAKGKRDLLVPTADGVKEPQNRRVEIVYGGASS